MHRHAFLLLLLPLLAAFSIARNAQWKDDGSLWEDILEKSPNKARAFNEYGLHVLAAGDPDRAIRLLNRSLQLDPYQPEIYVNLGLAFEKLGRVDDALAAYDRAIFTRPESPAAYYNLGVLYYRTLKDRSKALDHLLRARDLDPLEPDVHHYLASIYAEMGNTDASRQEMSLYDRYKH
ncbi:MAG: tetratricopeptide repeat protein [Nitrospirota bacterium]